MNKVDRWLKLIDDSLKLIDEIVLWTNGQTNYLMEITISRVAFATEKAKKHGIFHMLIDLLPPHMERNHLLILPLKSIL